MLWISGNVMPAVLIAQFNSTVKGPKPFKSSIDPLIRSNFSRTGVGVVTMVETFGIDFWTGFFESSLVLAISLEEINSSENKEVETSFDPDFATDSFAAVSSCFFNKKGLCCNMIVYSIKYVMLLCLLARASVRASFHERPPLGWGSAPDGALLASPLVVMLCRRKGVSCKIWARASFLQRIAGEVPPRATFADDFLALFLCSSVRLCNDNGPSGPSLIYYQFCLWVIGQKALILVKV